MDTGGIIFSLCCCKWMNSITKTITKKNQWLSPMTRKWLQRISNIFGIASMHWSGIRVGLTDMTSLRWQHYVRQHSHQAHWSWQTRSETWCTGWWWRTGEDLSVPESPGAKHQVVFSKYFTFLNSCIERLHVWHSSMTLCPVPVL